jgi:hypothetical protein
MSTINLAGELKMKILVISVIILIHVVLVTFDDHSYRLNTLLKNIFILANT